MKNYKKKIGSITTQKTQKVGPATKHKSGVQIGARKGERYNLLRDNTTFIFCPVYTGPVLPGSCTSQGAMSRRTGHSSFPVLDNRFVVQWDLECGSRETVLVSERNFVSPAELLRSRGSLPPWPGSTGLVPPRGGVAG
jgi:hypothetical protein